MPLIRLSGAGRHRVRPGRGPEGPAPDAGQEHRPTPTRNTVEQSSKPCRQNSPRWQFSRVIPPSILNASDVRPGRAAFPFPSDDRRPPRAWPHGRGPPPPPLEIGPRADCIDQSQGRELAGPAGQVFHRDRRGLVPPGGRGARGSGRVPSRPALRPETPCTPPGNVPLTVSCHFQWMFHRPAITRVTVFDDAS